MARISMGLKYSKRVVDSVHLRVSTFGESQEKDGPLHEAGYNPVPEPYFRPTVLRSIPSLWLSQIAEIRDLEMR